jgi:Tfp pilus assembly protein PilV
MNRERGFAMADALVALVIASLFLTSLLSVNTASLKSSGSASETLTATYVARAVLEDPSLREDQGQFLVDGRAYTWTRIWTDRPSAPADRAVLTDMTVKVSWPVGMTTRTFELRTTRLKGKRHEG